MSYTYEINVRCPHCDSMTEDEMPLIDAIDRAKVVWPDDVRKQGEQLMHEVHMAHRDFGRLCQMNPDYAPSYAKQLRQALEALEKQGADLLGIKKG